MSVNIFFKLQSIFNEWSVIRILFGLYAFCYYICALKPIFVVSEENIEAFCHKWQTYYFQLFFHQSAS